MGVQVRLGLSRLRLENAWRRGAWKAATAAPQRQGLAQQLYARKARGAAIKEKRHPSYFIPARGPPRMFHSGPGLQAFQTENLGREKPTTRCPGSVRAECAPQRDVVFAQRGPFFWSASGAQEKPHCYWSEKAAFPEDAEPGLQQRRACPLLGGRLPQTPGFVVQTSKLLKHPATQRRKTQTPGSGFAWR